ncbi:hypothetical protein JCM4814A_57060 [Streptomyces phaeofaciens JCM 4814]|uniref:Uncharacterized protein n=1 Tax=Streptomyces phaeofaciens TaxID=68254 RepID=A0A918HP25_9ACTN|nr:hypothetical protein [Streptomyces phaeofaciens]GGT88934.1 hypothetical protein GCM10010226_79100 [Streptomyces phaeofaciens]
MHTYDVPRRPAFASVPSARPAQDPQGGPSATPIYDALYAEYVKSFRSLPGDRSGEEELGFTAFGNIPHSTGTYGGHRPGSFSHSYSAYSAGAQSARQGLGQQSQWQRVGTIGQHPTPTVMQPVMQPVPAALPPGPRRGF